MTPGSIVHFKKFTFHDGAQADKYLVVLNAGGAKPYLVIKTTSQAKQGREDKEGCNSAKGYYFVPAGKSYFKRPTWFLLHEYYELEAAKFLQAKFSGDAEIVGTLTGELLRAIVNCAKRTDDWSGDYNMLLG